MGKNKLLPVLILLLILSVVSKVICGQEPCRPDVEPKDRDYLYNDGCYLGISRGEYILEPYWGIVNLNVKNGILSVIRFSIRDSSLHENFDENYEKHFEGNPLYIQQSRHDWAGVQTYPGKLAEKQDTDKLDAISGATWSYNIFRAAVSNAMKNGPVNDDTLCTGKRP